MLCSLGGGGGGEFCIQKTKIFFHKTMGNLKSLLVNSGYHKLPRAPSFKAVPSSESNTKMQQLDNLYRDISEEWEPELMDIKKDNNIMAKSASHRSLIASSSVVETTSQEDWHEVRKRGCFFIESGKERGYNLVEKMKELEMMDEYDMDHVMDVEQVLHHYSRLTCPLYLDIVDKFFMDMYSEFFLQDSSTL